MTIAQLIEAAKDHLVTPEQVESLRRKIESSMGVPEKLTHEFLNRTYNL